MLDRRVLKVREVILVYLGLKEKMAFLVYRVSLVHQDPWEGPEPLEEMDWKVFQDLKVTRAMQDSQDYLVNEGQAGSRVPQVHLGLKDHRVRKGCQFRLA